MQERKDRRRHVIDMKEAEKRQVHVDRDDGGALERAVLVST